MCWWFESTYLLISLSLSLLVDMYSYDCIPPMHIYDSGSRSTGVVVARTTTSSNKHERNSGTECSPPPPHCVSVRNRNEATTKTNSEKWNTTKRATIYILMYLVQLVCISSRCFINSSLSRWNENQYCILYRYVLVCAYFGSFWGHIIICMFLASS